MNRDEAVAQAKSTVKKGLAWGGGGLAAIIIGLNSYYTTELGYNYVVQNTLMGESHVESEVGVHFKVPFFTKITEYKQVATIGFGGSDGSERTLEFTRDLKPISVTFADTYNGEIPATFRFSLPRTHKEMLELHQEFRSFENLVDALLVKNAKNVTVVTGTQYTGEEFFQGGLNSFKVKLEDQLGQGLYVTEREQVEIKETDLAAVGANNNDAQKLETRSRLVWKNVVQLDEAGKPRRLANPLERYGITVSQVTIDKPIPEPRLQDLLTTKKELVAKRIAAEQEIITAQSEANAAQQRAEIDKRLAIQQADKERQLAIIAQQREVEVERQRAQRELVQKQKEKDVAVIQKQKELEVAQSNRDIQEANAVAAEFEAKAIREKGLAEAEVDKAKLAAKQFAKDIYMAEIQRDIARVLYENLSNFQVQMPNNVVIGDGSGKLPSNLDTLTTFGALGIMDKATQLAPEAK